MTTSSDEEQTAEQQDEINPMTATAVVSSIAGSFIGGILGGTIYTGAKYGAKEVGYYFGSATATTLTGFLCALDVKTAIPAFGLTSLTGITIGGPLGSTFIHNNLSFVANEIGESIGSAIGGAAAGAVIAPLIVIGGSLAAMSLFSRKNSNNIQEVDAETALTNTSYQKK